MLIDRIKEVVKVKGSSVKKFSEAINFNYTTLNNYFTGTRKTIDAALLEKIASTFEDVNYSWLLTGRGSMFREEQPVTAVPVIADESLLYKMYKEEKAEKEALIEQIGALKLTVRQQEEKILGLRQMEEAPFQKDSTESTPIRKKGVAGLGSVQFAGRE